MVHRRNPRKLFYSTEGEAATEPALKKTNLLLIGIDSLRADHVSSYGYHRLTTRVSRCSIVKGATFLCPRQKPGLPEHERQFGSQCQIDATCDGDLTLLVPQASKSQMNGYERRRTGCVDDKTGSLEIEEVGNAIGQKRK